MELSACESLSLEATSKTVFSMFSVHLARENGHVCIQALFTGLHTRPMPGVGDKITSPTNKPVKWPYCMVIKFKEGLVSELFEYYDQLNLMLQLGLV